MCQKIINYLINFEKINAFSKNLNFFQIYAKISQIIILSKNKVLFL